MGNAGDGGANRLVDVDSADAADDAEAGGGLMVAVIQLSIALGSTAGGVVFDHLGWQSAFGLSGMIAACRGRNNGDRWSPWEEVG